MAGATSEPHCENHCAAESRKKSLYYRGCLHSLFLSLERVRGFYNIAEEADLMICIGTRLHDSVTGFNSAFQNPDVRFVSINVDGRDAYKLGPCLWHRMPSWRLQP